MQNFIKNTFVKNKLDAALITDLANVRFLTGFTGTNGLCLITKTKQYFLTDYRYVEQAKKQIKGFTLLETKRDLFASLNAILSQQKVKRLGFEASNISYSRYLTFKKSLNLATLVPLTYDPGELRIIKNNAEVACLAKALAINKKAFLATRLQIKPGVTEIFVARLLEQNMLKFGAEKIAFDTIVASGTRGALPHGVASNKRLKRGELVTIDFGCIVNGYHSDETVTICLGEPSAKQKNIWQIVYDAQQAAKNLARPGVKCSALDKAARDYITKHGYGQNFGHALGHGVGLEIHERPVLAGNSPDILKPGMAFTIEPGIYLPNFGGVRIEDVFVCTKTGVKQLSQIDKRLL